MAGQKSFLSQFFIKIGGQNLPEALQDSLLEVVVDTSLSVPEMFTISISDPDLQWVDDAEFLEVGKPVEISAQAGGDIGGEEGLLMKGEITALEPSFSGQGETTVLVRGYSKAHRLHRGKKSRTFLNQSDRDIVSKIANEVGLSPEVDTTPGRHDHVVQNNQTNMEFLQSRAARLGFKVFATSEKLIFKKGEVSLGEGPELVLGETLRSFRPYFETTHQVNKVVVLGWDAKQKQQIKGEATPNSALNQGGLGKTGGDMAGVFGDAEMVLVNQPVFTPDEAKAMAEGIANDLSSQFMQAEGVCYGHPKVKAGYTVTIANIGSRFSGKYFVTSATHTINKEGYETTFSISGRQPNTLTNLLSSSSNGHGGSGQSQGQGQLLYGVTVGIVTNNNDPEDLGRVKLMYPWLGEDIESDWARVLIPGGGPERGLSYLPEIDDEVLIAFEHGSPHRPYILGGLANSKDKTATPNSQSVSGGKVNQRRIKSRSGHEVLLDDSQGAEQIVIRDKTGKNEIIIDSASNTMIINLDKDYKLTVKGDVVIDSKGNVSVKSTGNTQVESTANLNLKASGNLDLQATGRLSIKGTSVSIDGGPMTEVKGGVVKLN